MSWRPRIRKMMMRSRKSPRLPGYDYTLSDGYFVTINVRNNEQLFGEVTGDTVALTPFGEIAAQCWRDIPSHYAHVSRAAFVVMPNHVHGILWLEESMTQSTVSLGVVVATYKAAVTRAIRKTGSDIGQLWRGRYHDHIIRTEDALNTIRAYILTQ